MRKLSKLLILCLPFVLASCSTGSRGGNYYVPTYYEQGNSESYLELNERDFTNTSENNKANVSLDSSNAGYSNIRRLINTDKGVPIDAVNIEQMLNYFSYSYVNDTDKALKVFTEIADCPWNAENKLLSVAFKAKSIELEETEPNNFVFLIDVSGSMYSNDKLPLLQNAFKLLIDSLNDEDRISIVTYASQDRVLLDGAYGYEKTKISAIISDLEASGSTHGSQGIQTAYQLASKYYVEGGNNRVFLATDGDFNVGLTSTNELKNFISTKRQTGVYLSLFGFGSGNLQSSTMDTLAQAGNGNYYYVDSILEAQKVFVSELGGTLNTVAKDAKAQVEFNANIVEKYRLIGYENKILTNEEFENNETDAGEIGAGHTTICLIEIGLHDEYELANIVSCTLRYKDPTSEIDQEVVETCDEITEVPSNDFIFASAVAEFGLLLRNSDYKGTASYQAIIDRINNDEILNDDYRTEFIELVEKYYQTLD